MMKLQLSSSSSATLVNIQAKLPILQGGFINHQNKSLNPSFSLSSLYPSFFISNSLHHSQYPSWSFPPVNQSVAAILFGDGSKAGLYPLTKRRSEGAIPIAANYRIIDAVVSNCLNSNINKIYAFTQFNSASLNSHLSRAYSRLGKEGFAEVIAAYQSPEDQGWFQGTADAMRRCLWVLEEYPVIEFLVLPGHHLYRMDYQKLIEAHRTGEADITIVGLSAIRDRDPGFGILDLDSANQVIKFSHKSGNVQRNGCISVESSMKPNSAILNKIQSMGIYVINRDKMLKLLNESFPEANDFGIEVIPGAISIGMKVKGYVFDGYWEDMKSIGAFYRANMECIKKSDMEYNFYDKHSPLYTMPRCLPPTSVEDVVIIDSLIGDGCILNRCNIKGSVVGMRTRIRDGVTIEDSVIMGFDIYQKEDDQKSIPIGIGEDTLIRKAIVDKNVRIGKNVKIINKDNVQEGDREASGYIIREGVVVVIRSAVIPDGTIL
ncbi:inactive glucose-1-phosphate adenylyltransferase small subunit 2, chloroplastic isoform X1 [Carica papaya]|uniref:inactive glucose-1-phosphate adenylyltransferase small subunit 2, chloroplastic isoform X1 n=1 Tax=Carica papaya TaxID=3649 RepID=UPI000B8CF172|nr:inactive glucose-1-phosphate adenylyltransferase small subunit 2, chloroplastic isoform X1 [Carica papaya]